MDSKNVNPFLMDDFPAAPDAAAAPAFNPFLQDFGGAGAEEAAAAPPGADVNPFFSFGGPEQAYEPPAADSTNPFASFGMEAAAVPEPEAVFIEPEVATVPQPEPDLFGVEEPVAQPQPPAQVMSPPQEKPAVPPERPAPPPVPPAPAAAAPPPKPARPPPPPRPTPPAPPRNTKDLILSVTGAMDETSNQMLDRLQANRTPSPTLMHSPSPTPEHSFADLLDVDGGVPHTAHDDAQQTPAGDQQGDILGLYEAAPSVQDATPAAAFEAPADVAEPPPAPAVDKPDDAPPLTSNLTENPFSDVGQPEVQAFEPVYEQKRPSFSAATPVAAATPVYEEVEAAVPESQHFPEVTQAPASGMFGEVPEAAPAVDPASFFAQPAETAAAPANAFGNLIGDLSAGQNAFAPPPPPVVATEYSQVQAAPPATDAFGAAPRAFSKGDSFDAFASKFDKAGETGGDSFYDPFTGAPTGQTAMDTSSDVWGDSSGPVSSEPVSGFGDEGDGFDSFLSMTAPPPEVTPRRRKSNDSDDAPDFSVVIRDRDPSAAGEGGPVPTLAPPPKSPMTTAYTDSTPRFNPFDKSAFVPGSLPVAEEALPALTRTDSQETPETPLFDEDTSQPLEDFPRVTYTGDGWEMQLRMPIKKKITGQRFWKKIFVKLVYQGDSPVLQLFNKQGEKDPFQELPLLACYSVSEIAAQQFDQYGKIFTVKLQYIFYKERPGVRPGQVTKAERITNKLSQFAAYAIQGDLQGVKEFGSDLKKLGMPVEHAPQISQLFKLGSQTYEDMKTFSVAVEEALFRLAAHRDRALQYKMEEVQISVVDETYVEQNADGHVEKQIARVRLFFLGFISGMPDIELGINDIWRQGKEVVGRHDIIPVATEEWIRLENIEFHSCVQQEEYEKCKLIKFKPPDACYIELMRFRVRPPKNRELPLQLKAVMCVTGSKVELRADILVPGFASRKLGRVPCEDVMVRFPIPECWIYLFRVEKHFRYGSVKSAHRRTGKIKGIERLLGTMENMDPQLMEVTSGQAKYEHQHHAIVWRMPRLPKEGQGAYTTHQLVCRMNLTSYDQIPEKLSEYAYVEFTMPVTQVSHTTARSVSFQNFEGDEPPEKYVRNLSRHEYRVGIEHTQGEGPGAYVIATAAQPSTNLQTPKKTIPEHSGDEGTDHAASDSDSSD